MLRSTILLLMVASIVGCDYVNDPVTPGAIGGGGNDSIVLRRILLEEFTGHRCNNCPAAHTVAQQLDAIYDEELVVVGIHATSTFAAPLDPPAPDGRYSTDFRTPAGDTYTSTFGVSFLPTGMVSRKSYNSSITVAQGSWSSAISDLIGQPALFDLSFDELQHDGAANTVDATITVVTQVAIEADHKLTIYLLEDNVVDWQLNAAASPPDIENYLHRHVLRTTLNGTWGQDAVFAGTAAGDTLTFTVANAALDPAWDPANCSLVAYLYNTATNEVMQAVERKFQP